MVNRYPLFYIKTNKEQITKYLVLSLHLKKMYSSNMPKDCLHQRIIRQLSFGIDKEGHFLCPCQGLILNHNKNVHCSLWEQCVQNDWFIAYKTTAILLITCQALTCSHLSSTFLLANYSRAHSLPGISDCSKRRTTWNGIEILETMHLECAEPLYYQQGCATSQPPSCPFVGKSLLLSLASELPQNTQNWSLSKTLIPMDILRT